MFGADMALDPGKEISLRQFSRTQTDEGFVDLVVCLVDDVPVEVKESEHAGGSRTLISIEEPLVLCDEETICRGLGSEGWICVLAERALLWLKDGRFQEFFRTKTGNTAVLFEGSLVKALHDFY